MLIFALFRGFYRLAAAQFENGTMRLPAAQPIVDAPPITKVELKLGAVPPDCLLDEARKVGGVAWIEFPGINESRYLAQHIITATVEIAGRSIRVLGCEMPQNACSME